MEPAAPAVPREPPTVRIRPARGLNLNLPELWRYRELVYFFVWRQIKVRYKQTAIGAVWAVLQPVLLMAVFTLFFGLLANLPSDGAPYPVFYFAALVPWVYFSSALNGAANVLVDQQRVITRVYFPRLALPLASVIAPLLDLAIGFAVLLGLMLVFGLAPSLNLLFAPVFAVLAFGAALGVGLWLSALNALYRDVRYGVPLLLQLWLFASPVVYPSSMIPADWRSLYALNPMVSVIEGLRWAVTGQGVGPTWSTTLPSVLAVVAAILGGLLYFQRREPQLVDVV